MPETWIDDHVGDELTARAGFEAELRGVLDAEWTGAAAVVPRRRHRVRIALWAGAAAAVAAGTFIAVTRDDNHSIKTPAITEPSLVPDGGLAVTEGLLFDARWDLVSVDAQPTDLENQPYFRLDPLGHLTGSDGCNTYGVDGNVPLRLIESKLFVPDGAINVTGDCPAAGIVPFEPGTALSVVFIGDADTVQLTDEQGLVYLAQRHPIGPFDADSPMIGPRWDIETIDGAPIDADIEAWFQLDADGQLGGFDGCNSYGFQERVTTFSGGSLEVPIGSLGSTAVLCTDKMNRLVNPFAFGATITVRSIDGGRLELTTADGTVYVAREHDDAAPTSTADLVVPATGGAVIEPELIATMPFGPEQIDLIAHTNYSDPVALFGDSLVVIELGTNDLMTGRGIRLFAERAVLDLPGLAGRRVWWVAGGDDQRLYVASSLSDYSSLDVRALTLPNLGGTAVEADRVELETTGDSEFRLTTEGVELGGAVVIAAPAMAPGGPSATTEGMPAGLPPSTGTIVRTNPDGSTQEWTIDVQLDESNPPLIDVPEVEPLGNGAVVFQSMSSNTEDGRFIGVLNADGTATAYRLGDWEYIGVDFGIAYFSRPTELGLEIAQFPAASPLRFDLGTVAGYGIGFHRVDVVAAAVSAFYGEPTEDRGWFTTESVSVEGGGEDCMGGRTERVIHWGDLSVAWFMSNDPNGTPQEMLWSWVLGDDAAVPYGRREPVAVDAPPSFRLINNLQTKLALTSAETVFGPLTTSPPDAAGVSVSTLTLAAPMPASRSISSEDGAITGFGVFQPFC